ncbi:MAG: photosystem I reaction center subunit XII [Nostoc sp. CreGUA01]|jgi:photosystem I subunit 12|uniref:Photosystem I reaction center subunit XII n=1 Tax=Desmonostoc muscorum LEGE 12446 TaxID=1828758 RepID=A0A8J7D4P4_DESMC|nr:MULTISPECIES: photosystem I reaction center subunit XII [Nostocaceae]MBD2414490.1 photosystem I reaction center subunit XII [Nostoc calcicola FACHB-3891]MBD2519992.1 photosystem I reaction center subunit XII [Nostoc sp. FACHB-973]MBW4677959.1 photosystem I reaction center subunit XII [Desmonostoc geniculatum HA4340-LM1]MBX9256148.1 photosystem I reaction center subunit XII [Desmonostoc muscorum CCALA 125]MDZ8004225.1 photosystem I reaction center subunit XII [Nostoc sp. DedSLP05]MDZ8039438
MPILDTLYIAQVSSLSDTQVYIALVVALIPGVLAWRLATELYK